MKSKKSGVMRRPLFGRDDEQSVLQPPGSAEVTPNT
jgi:hypothetical protein